MPDAMTTPAMTTPAMTTPAMTTPAVHRCGMDRPADRRDGGRPGVKPPGVNPPAAGWATGWRRWLQLSLAACWLLDAVLQYQSFMFGSGFARMLATAARGNPPAVAGPVLWSAHLIGQHPAVANAGFATGQLLLAIGIAWRPTVRIALAASAAWALAVWWLGEGLGGVLTSGAGPAAGAPGPALFYALLAVLLWPASRDRPASFAAGRAVGPALARVTWVLVWGSLAWFTVAGAREGTPGGTAGPGALLLAAAFCLVAAGILLPAPAARATVALAVTLSLALWAAGQHFGDMASGTATDPGTGPPLALLALAYWPAGPYARPAGSQAGLTEGRTWSAGSRAWPAGGPCWPAGGPCWPARMLTWPGHLVWWRGRRREPGTSHSRPQAPRRPGAAPGGLDVVVMQVIMVASMAVMLAPRFDPLRPAAWQGLAAAGTAWFGWRCGREMVAARQAAGAGGLRHLPHVLACGAMLYMLPAASSLSAGAATDGMGTAHPPALALVLAAALAVSAVVTTDRLTVRPHACSAVLVPRLAACCQIAMGISMACLLIQMA